jgi:hypothetical protein
MPLPYYRRLSARDKAIYRQSDAIGGVPLPDAASCRPLAVALEGALGAGDRPAVEKAAQRLVARIAHQLGTEPVTVRVLARRPRSRTEELHGLYTREEGQRAIIQVWMRTAQHRRVASFRTFLRTLLHELCHHLDYAHFELADSFHTEGFFRRESSLMRQLVPKGGRAHRPAGASREAAPPIPGARGAEPGDAGGARPPSPGEPRQIPLPF